MPSTCVPYGFETATANTHCMNHCPASCYPGDMPCPGGTDWMGCPIPDYCISSKSWQRGWDMATHTTIDCPNHCEPSCNWETEIHCPGVMDEFGCNGPASCIPNNLSVVNADGSETWCMPHCPVSCYQGEQVCPGGLDGMGCPSPDYCMPQKGWNDCPVYCEPTCDWSKGEVFCPGNWDEASGCYGPSFCSTDGTCAPAL